MRITKRKDFPKCVRHFKELKGICIGECIYSNGEIDKDHLAHAHCFFGKHQGWICLRYRQQLKERLTLLHEVAHLIANVFSDIPPHGKLWKNTVVAIGGTYKSYSYIHNYREYEYLDYTHRTKN